MPNIMGSISNSLTLPVKWWFA